jgi:peptidoglycan L-alanyl-D-glutamate endopeptidase CwlK
MPKYSQKSQDKLKECHQDLQTIFNYVIQHWDNTIITGHRSKEEQDDVFQKGYSKVKWPNSKHNSKPSMAVDSVPYPIEWTNTDRMKIYVGFVLGVARRMLDDGEITHELVSGLDWDNDTFIKDHTFHDHPHFQLKPVNK